MSQEPRYGENRHQPSENGSVDSVSEQVDFSAVGQELTAKELEMHRYRIQNKLRQAEQAAARGTLDDAHLSEVASALFNARHLLKTLSGGEYADTSEMEI